MGVRAHRPEIGTIGNGLPLGEFAPLRFHTGSSPLCFTNPPAQERFRHYTSFAGLDGDNLLDIDMPMILSIAGITQMLHFAFWRSYIPVPGRNVHFMSQQLLLAQLDAYYSHTLDFYRLLVGAGKVVICVMPPGMRSNIWQGGDLFLRLRAYVTKAMAECGVQVADVTEATCDTSGVLAREYWAANEEDIWHANDLWGKAVAVECCKLLGL